MSFKCEKSNQSKEQFKVGEEDLAHMELDTYLRDLSLSGMEVDSDNKVTCGGEVLCSAPTMRGEVEVGWEIVSQNSNSPLYTGT